MLALQVVIVTHLKYLLHFSHESVFASKLISQPIEFNLEPLSTLSRAEPSWNFWVRNLKRAAAAVHEIGRTNFGAWTFNLRGIGANLQ